MSDGFTDMMVGRPQDQEPVETPQPSEIEEEEEPKEMSSHKKAKLIGEAYHRKVLEYLKKKFPDCEVTYDGDQGIDYQIVYKGNVTLVETKTCNVFVRQGIDWKHSNLDETHRIAKEKVVRPGRIRITRSVYYPYKTSQHGDLAELGGWYIIVVRGTQPELLFGIKASEIDRSPFEGEQHISWVNIYRISQRNWLNILKKQVYATPIEHHMANYARMVERLEREQDVSDFERKKQMSEANMQVLMKNKVSIRKRIRDFLWKIKDIPLLGGGGSKK